jgi:hypothetical protein
MIWLYADENRIYGTAVLALRILGLGVWGPEVLAGRRSWAGLLGMFFESLVHVILYWTVVLTRLLGFLYAVPLCNEYTTNQRED